ncbi:hypothetical protein CA13_36810 [Planctomycetes bacterium CA13]|uniref:Uncharacterized protein n=1 Tax=Novipirellula herctigrandis TaxID=2527986 RepID=A0A5C5Z4U6_9BACT|nr:hypothetical protein CA13_36810 [Planctomycetes bacterium CA13]
MIPCESKETYESKGNSNWDPIGLHSQLGWLTAARSQFRFRRTIDRLLSPRRILATVAAAVFVIAYLLYGILVLSHRAPADPDRLRCWLSGGMVLYAIYHAVRCLWSESVDDLEMTAAECLWLGGAPLRRSTIAVYRITNIVAATAAKTGLLAVVIAGDVAHIELLMLGVFCSLLMLDIVRQIFQIFASGLDARSRRFAKAAIVCVVIALSFQILGRLIAMTPVDSPTLVYVFNTFRAIGETAECGTIQMLALPWISSASVAVADHYGIWAALSILSIAVTVPASVWLLVKTDKWAQVQQRCREQRLLAQHALMKPNRSKTAANSFALASLRHSNLIDGVSAKWSDLVPLLSRQWKSMVRYRGTILFSFLIPTILCLSPLIANQVTEQWLFVVGGVGLCTMLLAPPALRLDFRRDLLRMQLLKSLPVRPLSMVMGQLSIPIAITWGFQFLTITIAAMVVQTGFQQWLLWTAMMAALAVFTFAVENALFLAYPHHPHQQGLSMMIRAKLTFLGKATLIAGSIAILVLWASLCGSIFPASIQKFAFIGGAIMATWGVAILAVFVTTWCWRRFDLSFDLPPQ